MDQLLVDAKHLAQRLHFHDSVVDSLVGETTGLQGKLNAMKQYRSGVSQLNDIGKHKPKSTLILGEQLENQRIKELELENQELQISLAEHQSALMLIMKKYREQMVALLKANGLDKNIFDCVNSQSEECEHAQDTIVEMKAMVKSTMMADEEAEVRMMDVFYRLRCENETLRELLNISHTAATIRRRKDEKSPAREQRMAKKSLSLPLLDDGAAGSRQKSGNRLKIRSAAFNHKDASQLLFPGLSPVEKEFSPKSLGAWIKSEESSHRKTTVDTTAPTNEVTDEPSRERSDAPDTPQDEAGPALAEKEANSETGNSNGPVVVVVEEAHDPLIGEAATCSADVLDRTVISTSDADVNGERNAVAEEEDQTDIEENTIEETRGSEVSPLQRKKSNSLSIASKDGAHGQAIVFENAHASHDNDTIVYDISYELSCSDEDDNECYVDEEEASEAKEDDNSDSDGDEESALAELDLVVDEFENEATDAAKED